MRLKNYREMSAAERRRHSLSAKLFRDAVLGSLALGILSLVIGLGLYAAAMAGQYIGIAFNLSRNAAGILDKICDAEVLADKVMTVYRNLPDEVRRDPDSGAYSEAFLHLEGEKNYRRIKLVLTDFVSCSDVDDVYLAMYDEETSALVYAVNPEGDTIRHPGYWEKVDKKELDTFLNWNWKDKLYAISRTEKYGWLCTSGFPILGEDGKTHCYVLTDVTLGEVTRAMRLFVLQYTLAVILMMALMSYLLNRRIRRWLVMPINSIALAAESYARDKKAGKEGEHFSRLDIHTGDEVENLSLILTDMEHDLQDYEENLTKVTAQEERIHTELSLANRIQADMLPNKFPPFPDRTDFDIYASMEPAREIGGDFYDFFMLGESKLGLVMADVSGKGIPAALFMMHSRILVQNYAKTGLSPAEVLENVNSDICANNREGMFVTVWFGILDLESGVLTAANAGHEYPILKQADGKFELIRDRHGFVIGGMENIHYRNYELKLEPGAKLFLYTDGLTEATDAFFEMFGMDRTVEALNSGADGTPQQLLDRVDAAVAAFVRGAEQFDDLTMMCVWYIGN